MKSCIFLGQKTQEGIYRCEKHGMCSFEILHPRITFCPECEDFFEKDSTLETKKEQLLGDQVEAALTKVGITKERVSRWLGADCNCEERKQKLNNLHAWAKRVISGKTDKAEEYLDKIME